MSVVYQSAINVAWNQRGVVFGGYVRDLLCDQVPGDLDLWFHDEEAKSEFLLGMMKLYPVKLEKDNRTLANYGFGPECSTITVEGHKIDLAVHHTSPIGEDSNEQSLADFDVNMLSLEGDRICLLSPSWFDLSLTDVIRNCVQKRAMTLSHRPVRRLKMIRKGFEVLNAQS